MPKTAKLLKYAKVRFSSLPPVTRVFHSPVFTHTHPCARPRYASLSKVIHDVCAPLADMKKFGERVGVKGVEDIECGRRGRDENGIESDRQPCSHVF